MTTPSEGPVPLAGTGIADDELELGFVSGFFGVKGEVRLHLHNRETTLFQRPRDVVLVGPDGKRMAARLSARPGAGKRVLGRIAGIRYRDQAELWLKWKIVVPRTDLPALDEDEFYLADVEGLPVHVNDEPIGRVAKVHATGPIEVLEINVGSREPVFVPCEAELVRIDLDAAVVHVVAEAME